MIPVEGSIMIAPTPGKFGIYIMYFDVSYCFPSSDFLLELLNHLKIHIDSLVPFRDVILV